MDGTDLVARGRAAFAEDYAGARRLFLSAAETAGAPVTSHVNPSRGPKGEELATDVAWIGPQDAPNVVTVLSGTHGGEGFCGSGIQVDWLRSGGPSRLPRGTAVLMLHGVNPFGFSWLRRVTEEGVDLNRNWVDFGQKLPENPDYTKLLDAWIPDDYSEAGLKAADAKIAEYGKIHGPRALTIARSQGQYDHPEGMFYGGTGPTWARRTQEQVIRDFHLADRKIVAGLDMHTGLGQYGFGEPLCHHPAGSMQLKRVRDWWGESVSEPAAGTGISIPRFGLTTHGWNRLVGEPLSFVTLEYGTYSNEVVYGALRHDQWLHTRGKAIDWDSPETRAIKAELRRAFYPDTDSWRELVLFRGHQMIRQALQGMAA
jgi:hypothetical protein